MRRQVTWNPAGRAGTILIEREELYASVDRVAQEDRETVADLSLPTGQTDERPTIYGSPRRLSCSANSGFLLDKLRHGAF